MEGTRTWSYREVLQQVKALTSYLNSLDFPRGSRIAILSENRYEWAVAYLAVVALGLIAVPLDAQGTLKEWALILRHSEARLLFCSEKLEGHFSKMPKGLEGLERIAFGERFEEILRRNAGGLNEEECPPVGESDVATLVFTSGTTGTPKGVLLSHGNLLNSAREMGTEYSDEGGIAASILPFNHIYGFAVLTSRIHRGHSLAIFRTVSEPLIFEALARLRPYTLVGVPLLFERMGRSIKERLRKEMPKFAFDRIEKLAAGSWGLDADAWRSIKRLVFAKVHAVFGGRMTHFASGGAPMDVDLVRFFQTLGIAICQGYGLTETGPLITMGRRKTSRPGAVGLPVGGMSVKIDNPDLNGVGEILVKGQGVMQGYFRKPEETARVIDGNGWFRTGDLGRWDEHGYLHISGRLKEMIVTSNGKKIYPADHFALYESIPGVREACLFGVPDRFGRGEVVHLHIFPDPDLVAAKGRDAVVSEIKEGIAAASGQLPEYQRPNSVDFSEEAFPRSASLKIKKHEVRKVWLESRQKSGPAHADSGNHKTDDDFLHSEASQVVLRILKSLMPHPVTINMSTSLELDLGMDSLTQIEFWSTLEKNLNVKLPEDAIARLKVVGHIIEYLLKNAELGEKAHETLKEISQKNTASTVGSWFEILGHLTPQQQETADRIVASCPRARPLFLTGR